MKSCADYTDFRDGQWRVWMCSAFCDYSVWQRLRKVVEERLASGRPQILRLTLPRGGMSAKLLLKLYPPARGAGRLKDVFRISRARRYWKQARSLSNHGFLTPRVWAVGERRGWARLELSFIVVEMISAQSLSTYLWRDAAGGPRLGIPEKRAYIRDLGRQVGRMHRLGFVHGDLVLSNILLSKEGNRAVFYFIDHDRTRRYPAWLPQTLWKRNLIQLNRLVFPDVSAQDRLRFFHAYLEGREKPFGARERRWLRQLARRTLARRKETRRQGRDFREPRQREYAELFLDGSDST